MTFGGAVRSGFDNYANFSGRSSRSAYWWWALFNWVAGIVAMALDSMLRPGSVSMETAYGTHYGVISGIVSLALLLPSLAVLVRRLHDTDRSGWWFWIVVIPIIGWLVLLFFLISAGTPGPNRFGPPPRDSSPEPRYDLPPVTR
ncbi:MAG: DUF805 domain-containing protein [Thermomicrobiales bacterium]|nr:DUF805 domain-containing protein [Thermomicrobiales bacterium]